MDLDCPYQPNLIKLRDLLQSTFTAWTADFTSGTKKQGKEKKLDANLVGHTFPV